MQFQKFQKLQMHNFCSPAARKTLFTQVEEIIAYISWKIDPLSTSKDQMEYTTCGQETERREGKLGTKALCWEAKWVNSLKVASLNNKGGLWAHGYSPAA